MNLLFTSNKFSENEKSFQFMFKMRTSSQHVSAVALAWQLFATWSDVRWELIYDSCTIERCVLFALEMFPSARAVMWLTEILLLGQKQWMAQQVCKSRHYGSDVYGTTLVQLAKAAFWTCTAISMLKWNEPHLPTKKSNQNAVYCYVSEWNQYIFHRFSTRERSRRCKTIPT